MLIPVITHFFAFGIGVVLSRRGDPAKSAEALLDVLDKRVDTLDKLAKVAKRKEDARP